MSCRSLTPINNIENAPVLNLTGKKYTTEQVKTAIIRAGITRGWVIQEIKPGLLQGDINVRGKHNVTVEIPYNQESYSIIFKKSDLPQKSGKIHPKYNIWINNLNSDIRVQLTSLNL